LMKLLLVGPSKVGKTQLLGPPARAKQWRSRF
jgi:hypothetical protein